MIEDDDYDYEDDYEDDDLERGFVGDDTWEDQEGLKELKLYLKIPEEWYLVKIMGFNGATLSDIDTWLKDNCDHPYKRMGWSSGCSSKVGVAFESDMDAVMFKLRWR